MDVGEDGTLCFRTWYEKQGTVADRPAYVEPSDQPEHMAYRVRKHRTLKRLAAPVPEDECNAPATPP